MKTQYIYLNKQYSSNWFLILLLFVLNLISASSIHAQKSLKNGKYLWVHQNANIRVLDSLLNEAPRFALNKNDYNRGLLQSVLDKKLKWKNETDSLLTDSLINKVALHFFNDLAYGNQPPALQNDGLQFALKSYPITDLLAQHVTNKSLVKLAHFFNSQSKEVSILMNTLNIYLDSSKRAEGRIHQLMRAINHYRWLRAVSEQQRVILVNIPSAQLRVYEKNKTLLSMKLIVGKEKNPTNTFSSLIKELTINPYWNVPKSIAVKEMLPHLKKDRSYLERNHLQVLNSNYRIINGTQINWYEYSENYFPFYIRQSTGCDNSLGVIKLEFDSPFGVYLHDTPEKSLFANASRFYSHGCMRMEKPIQMAKLLMEKNKIALDTIDLEKCYKRPAPIKLPLPIPVPLVVWYNLVDFNSDGAVTFYRDVYHRFTN